MFRRMGLKGTICAFPPQGHLAECRNSPFAPFQWQASKRLLGVLCDGLQKGAQSVFIYDHEKVREERVLLPTPLLCCGGPIPDFPLRDVERRCPASEDQLGPNQLLQGIIQLRLPHECEGTDQPMRELPAEHRSDLLGQSASQIGDRSLG